MCLLPVSLFALTLPVLSMRAAPADDQPAPKFEVRALRALAEADREALRLLAAEFGKLPAAARRKLPLRVREDSVEFAFRGEFPGDQFRAHMLEYLVSGPAKDYES